MRYVAVGSSTASGYQSGGIDSATQQRAYPVLLAQRADADFRVPLLGGNGCPPPYTAPYPSLTRPDWQQPCTLASQTALEYGGRSLAAPTVRTKDAVDGAGAQHIQSLLLAGKTQLQALAGSNPTFVTVHLGDEDALAATSGVVDESTLTPLVSFEGSYNQIVGVLKVASSLKGAALLGVLDPVSTVPLLQPGTFFFLSRDAASGRFQGKPVNANCSPVNALGQPNPLAANLVNYQVITNPEASEINCDPAVNSGRFVLDQAEIVTVKTRVAQYNTAIKAIAEENNWVFLDPNALLAPLIAEKDAQGRYQRLRKCQDLASASTAAQFQSAVLRSCPVAATGATAAFAAPNYFGSLISLDGYSPSNEHQTLIAVELAKLVNARYGTTLTTIQ